MTSLGRIENLTGQKFGRLIVINYSGKNDNGRTTWNCQCECGNQVVVVSYSLKSGDTTSCGCFREESLYARHQAHRDNMIGKTFGRLLVLNVSTSSSKGTSYTCQCICGNTTIVKGANITNGHTKSCGCLGEDSLYNRNQAHRDNMIGKTFGRLLVLNVSKPCRGLTRYNCQCECGNQVVVIGTNLSSGSTTSCGCYNREVIRNTNRTHGLSKHRLYSIWNGMVQRCNNTNISSYRYYGGRGVSVCSEWKNSFESFFDWAMNNGYQEGLTIDRYPNNDGNYEPGNCRWTTVIEQNRNKRNIILTPEDAENIRNDNRSQIAIAADYGISQTTVSSIKLNKIWR